MAQLEECSFTLSFSSAASVEEEQDNYLTEIEGEILCYDGAKDRQSVAGKLRLFFADLDEVVLAGYDPYYILDMKIETAPFY